MGPVDSQGDILDLRERGRKMALHIGDRVVDPRNIRLTRVGRVVAIRSNPACLMREIVVHWEDARDAQEQESLDEIEFGPLDD